MSELFEKREPQFTQPVNQIILMLVVCGLVAVGSWLLYGSVAPIFLASPYLNGFIFLVFLIGMVAVFWQVIALIFSVSWIEGFALDRPGHEFVKAPGLLASLAALLRKRGARHALTSTSTRSILDSVATRVDEGREINRYLINLLIFLGLLGTFYGLATTVPAVVDTIRSLAPQEGQSTIDVFDNLMTGLEAQLGGMGVAFGSSLLGLAGSLVVGLLDLFAGHGQNRFYRELEEWLSSITRLGVSVNDGEEGGNEGYAVAELFEYTVMQLETMNEIMTAMKDRKTETDERLDRITALMEQSGRGASSDAINSLASSQQQIAQALSQRSNGEEVLLDAETRGRLRNIDAQLLRILEEMSVGRQNSINEIRGDLSELTKAMRVVKRMQTKG